MAFNYKSGSYMGLANAKNQQQQSLFDQLARGISNYQRGKDRELMEKRIESNENVRLAKMQQDANSPANLLNGGLVALAQGREPTPEQMAQVKVYQAKQRDTQNPITGDIIKAPNVIERLGGSGMFETLNPSIGKQGQGSNPAITQSYDNITPSVLDDETIGTAPNTLDKPPGIADTLFNGIVPNAPPEVTSPRIDTTGMNSKEKQLAKEEAIKSEFDITKEDRAFNRDKKMEDYKNEIKTSADLLKTKQGKQKVTQILSRMNELNEALKDKGAIVSSNQGVLDNFKSYLDTTSVGQEVRKFSDPAVQQYADEYDKLRNTLLPFYASAAGLGAKSLDSDGERKAILSSFGDAGGIYESNKSQLENLRQLFGAGEQPEQQKPTSEQSGGWSIKRVK